MQNYKTYLVAFSAALSFHAESSIGANLLVDASFESGPPGTPTLPAGSNLLPGWTIPSGAIDVVTGFQNHDGIRCVDLDGFFQTGALSQTVNVQAGQSYLLSFWMAGNPQGTPVGAPVVKQMDVAWGNSSLGTFSFDVTGKTISNMGWNQYSLQVQATGSQMTLLFTSLDAAGSAYGPCIDDVSLTAVPEPQTLSLFGICWVLGSYFWWRRK
jgi:choice-of-anchor C domain-containing protein